MLLCSSILPSIDPDRAPDGGCLSFSSTLFFTFHLHIFKSNDKMLHLSLSRSVGTLLEILRRASGKRCIRRWLTAFPFRLAFIEEEKASVNASKYVVYIYHRGHLQLLWVHTAIQPNQFQYSSFIMTLKVHACIKDSEVYSAVLAASLWYLRYAKTSNVSLWWINSDSLIIDDQYNSLW